MQQIKVVNRIERLDSSLDFKHADHFVDVVVHLVGKQGATITLYNGIYRNCSIISDAVSASVGVIFDRATFINCRFIGGTGQRLETQIRFESCKIEGCAFSQRNIQLYFNSSTIHDSIDSSHSRTWICNSSVFFGCKFFGTANNIELRDSFISGANRKTTQKSLVSWYLSSLFSKKGSSVWEKSVTLGSKIKHVRFVKSKVNLFELTAQADEIIKLDVSNSDLVDYWSVLRREYSGTRFILILFFTLVFFLPIILKYFGSIYVGKTFELGKAFGLELQFEPLYRLILFDGKTGIDAALHAIITSLLLFYNIGRFYVTMAVAKFVEEEKHKLQLGIAIAAPHPDKLLILFRIHKVLKFVFIASTIYLIYKIYGLVLIEVAVLP